MAKISEVMSNLEGALSALEVLDSDIAFMKDKVESVMRTAQPYEDIEISEAIESDSSDLFGELGDEMEKTEFWCNDLNSIADAVMGYLPNSGD